MVSLDKAVETAAIADPVLEDAPPPRPITEFWFAFSRNRGALAGLVVIATICFVAIFADVLAPHLPNHQYRDALLAEPLTRHPELGWFLLGTDDLGRDILSRVMHGARLSMSVGFLVVALALTTGIVLGLIAGFFPGVLGIVIMRAMDIMLSLPTILLAIVIVAILGPSLTNAIMAVAIVQLPHFVRLTRAAVMTERSKDYVVASRVSGAGLPRLMVLTVLPNCMPPLIVQATLGFSTAVLDAAALGFLGLGAQPPTPEWGTMLAGAMQFVQRAWWVVTFPGVAILVTVLAFNLLGDGLRDALDPKLKQS